MGLLSCPDAKYQTQKGLRSSISFKCFSPRLSRLIDAARIGENDLLRPKARILSPRKCLRDVERQALWHVGLYFDLIRTRLHSLV